MTADNNIIIFDLIGKFAHFKKFYTNSSSLSYPFPPRTVIEGIISAILGKDRDTYYELFSPRNCAIVMSSKTKTRSVMQTVNYLSVKEKYDLNGWSGRTQIPFELIVPRIFDENLRYRIYLRHDNEILKEISDRLRLKQSFYPTSFGSAQFLCSAELVSKSVDEDIISEKRLFEEVQTPLVAVEETVDSLLNDKNSGLKIVNDIFPFHFYPDRKPGKNIKLLYEKDCNTINIKNASFPLHRISYIDSNKKICETIVFPEEVLNGQ
jgi:CRISPR-associated protein Cas5h